MKKTTKILIVLSVIGLSLLLYPAFSNYWNQTHATQAISDYSEKIGDVDSEKYEEMWAEAVLYNRQLAERTSPVHVPDDLKYKYDKTLDATGTGIMGYIEIPSIGVSLPVYHGTSAGVLQIAVGHLDWSSLPTGGENTHCVLSGHRGLPSAKLFTDLNKMREGDTFSLMILNEVLTYEVDQIRTVLPNDYDYLLIESDMDLCTLVTCTPYGINSHRLLVRGHRIATAEKSATVISEAVIVDQVIVAFYLALPLLVVLILIVMLKKPPKKKIPVNVSEGENIITET